jgi:transcription initiation factor TFIIIB Brf1 subunit/transcription initiation factor TFIIB
MMDQSPEWNSSNGENGDKKDPSRCGCPINPMFKKSSMSTMIMSNKHRFMKRLHQQMSMDYVERARYHIFEGIAKMAGDIGNLPNNVVEQAKYYYKILSERKLSRGVIRQGLIACCILHACKAMNVPRSMKEISSITSITTATINKTNKLFYKIMHDVLVSSNNDDKHDALESTSCKHLINRYCNYLGLDKSNEIKLVRYANKVNERIQLSGLLDCKTPSAVAAGVIMHSCNHLNIDMSKFEVSKRFDISVVTINKIMKIISDNHTVLELHTID